MHTASVARAQIIQFNLRQIGGRGEAVRRCAVRGVGKLDVDLMRDTAPWGPLSNGNTREFSANRVSNYSYRPVYGGAIMHALAIK